MSIDDRIDENEDLRAAEYVLGLLDAAARNEAEARLRTDAMFAAEIARWEARFAPWLQAIPPVDVPSNIWPRIQSRLWSGELPQRAAYPSPGTSMWESLALWRGLAAVGLAASAVSLALVAIFLRPPHGVPSPAPPVVVVPPPPTVAPMTVALRNDDGSIAYTATLGADGALVLTPVHVADPRAPELWLIPPGDRPHSLGMLPRDRAIVVRIPAALRVAARNGVFAISLEPRGSGPHEAPTGPVVAKGGMVAL